MSEIAWVLVAIFAWLMAGLGAALVIGRVARRGDEETRRVRSRDASRTRDASPRHADHRSDDGDT